MFDNAPIGIVQSDVDGRLLGANAAAARMLGYDSPEDNLASVENIAKDLYVDPDRRRKLIELSRDRNQLRGFETRFRRKDGRVITCTLGETGMILCVYFTKEKKFSIHAVAFLPV